MSLFQERSRVATRLTYRAVGSSTGQLEFLGEENGWKPHSDFGAGDIPIPTDNYDALNLATNGGNTNMLHLPFALSSVSFFHNIPGVPDGKDGLKLNACLLARIFDGKIRYWNNPEVLAENGHLRKELEAVADGDTPIYVSRRVHGSSSTASITKYLNEACPSEWKDDKVGSELGAKGLAPWFVGSNACEGSGGMTTCIRENAGAIGYLDSGHGWSEKLAEVNVENKSGFFVTSRISREENGITSAAAMATEIPLSTDADWGKVHFINKDGEWTWPIVVMSYVYIRKDIATFITGAEERGLLKLFLEALYHEDYFPRCEKLGFSGVPTKLDKMAKEGLEEINWNFPLEPYNLENMWSHESKEKTRKIDGMGPFVISGKRQNLMGLAIDEIAGLETDEQIQIAELNELVEELRFIAMDNDERADDARVTAALVLSSLSFTILCCMAGWLVFRSFLSPNYKSYDSQIPQNP